MIPGISNSSGLYIRESTPRIVLSCLPVVGIAMLIYNLYLVRVQNNNLTKRYSKLNIDLEKRLKERESAVNHHSSSLELSLHHQNQSLQTREKMICYLEEENKRMYSRLIELGMSPQEIEALDNDQTIEGTEKRMKECDEIGSQFEQEIERIDQHKVTLIQNSEIVGEKSEEIDGIIASIELQKKDLEKRGSKVKNQADRFFKYFMLSNIVSLALVISGIALELLGTMGILLCAGTLIFKIAHPKGYHRSHIKQVGKID